MILLHKILNEIQADEYPPKYNTEEIWVNKGAIVQIDTETCLCMDGVTRKFTRVWLINGLMHRVIEKGAAINKMEN